MRAGDHSIQKVSIRKCAMLRDGCLVQLAQLADWRLDTMSISMGVSSLCCGQ